jgi:YggT family protein
MALTLACLVVEVYTVVLLLRLLVGWLSVPDTGVLAMLSRGLWAATEPVLVPIRSVIRPVQLGSAAVDLSPLLFLVALLAAASVVCR